MLSELEKVTQLIRPMMKYTFVLYRFPDTTYFTCIAQNDASTSSFLSLSEIKGLSGYLIVPFYAECDTPIVVIRPDQVRHIACPPTTNTIDIPLAEEGALAEWHTAYRQCFQTCSAALKDGAFEKLVLSRRADYTASRELPLLQLFLTACQAYPHQFISLWSSPVTGSWLTATPEKLLSGTPRMWETMSLAGTMEWNEENANPDLHTWSAKDKREQDVVTTYLRNQLENICTSIHIGRPLPARAANVVHLRTNITFSTSSEWTLERLLDRLHPTPAVCGQPRSEALHFLRETEPHNRRYYAGFSGPLRMNDESAFYVSLRCMEARGSTIHCYAGGGLLPDSIEENEWNETQRKLRTMLNLFNKS